MKKQLQDFLEKHIPLAKAMGIEVISASKKKVVLNAPLKNNINNKNTAFGGSLHSLATLSCWGLLYLNLTPSFDPTLQIVITSSNADYLSPVAADFSAECSLPDEAAWVRFMATLQKKKKGRITLQSRTYQDDKLCFDYTGTFAAILPATT